MLNILSIYLWIWICVLFAALRGTEFSSWLYCWVVWFVFFFSQKDHKLPWHCDKILLLLLLMFFGTGTLCFPPLWKCRSHVSLYSLRKRKKADSTLENFSSRCCCCSVARGWRQTTEWKVLCSVKCGQGHVWVQHVIRILDICRHFEHLEFRKKWTWRIQK